MATQTFASSLTFSKQCRPSLWLRLWLAYWSFFQKNEKKVLLRKDSSNRPLIFDLNHVLKQLFLTTDHEGNVYPLKCFCITLCGFLNLVRLKIKYVIFASVSVTHGGDYIHITVYVWDQDGGWGKRRRAYMCTYVIPKLFCILVLAEINFH